jgi:hypothetical protein
MGIKIARPQTPLIADPDTGRVNQAWATQLHGVFDAVAGPFPLRSHTVSTLPDAAKYEGHIIYVPDASGGKCAAVSDGTHWKKVSLGATVS